MNTSDLISLLGLGMGLTSFLGGLVLWYKGAIEKRYAAQRDFGHLKRNQEQLASSLETVAKDFDHQLDILRSDTKEIKAYTLTLSQRFETILTRLDAQSGILNQRVD
jgi:hypothetical protein